MIGSATKKLWDDLVATIHSKTSPLGFRCDRRAGRFYLYSDSVSAIIAELQKSSKTTPARLVVTANAGLWNRMLAEQVGGPSDPVGLGAMDCLWWIRAGQLSGGEERWWNLERPDDVIALGSDIWSSFFSPAITMLSTLRDDAGLLDYLCSNSPPFLDPMNRWAFALALASSLGRSDAVKLAKTELQNIGLSRRLPVHLQLLLRSADKSQSKVPGSN